MTVIALMEPEGFEADVVAVLKPKGDLLDGGGFQIGGKGLAAGHRGVRGRRARKEVAAGVGDAGQGVES